VSRDLSDHTWVQTFKGIAFYPLDPSPDDVEFEDIAHALSNTCRYNGHSNTYYSVAEHCVHASFLVPIEDAAWALMHDAAEAYVGDMVRPLKHSAGLSAFRDIEAKVMEAVCKRFNLPIEEPASIRHADLVMLATERRALFSTPPRPWSTDVPPADIKIRCWHPAEARVAFRARARQLCLIK